jgi:hypothetical protein
MEVGRGGSYQAGGTRLGTDEAYRAAAGTEASCLEGSREGWGSPAGEA